LNMGGPSTTDEVGNFLSRLFVSNSPYDQVETKKVV
jgi:protoheme ferro-lyase